MIKNNVKNVTDYVQYKLENPDYQIPMIQDWPFKAIIMGFKVFTLKIIAEILGLKYEDIKDSYFVSNELPLNQDSEKESIMDTLIATGKYSYVNLEANNYKSDPSIVKNLNYGYRLIISKQVKGNDYIPINFTQINFDNCDFNFNQKIINRFFCVEKDLGIEHPFAIKTVRIALDNLDKNPYNETISDWLYRALKLLTSDSISYSKTLAGDDPILNEVVDFMEKFSSVEKELLYVNKKEEEAKLKNSEIEMAKMDGKIEGEIEGEIKKQKEIINNLTKMKMKPEQIAMAVNLSLEEVLKIQKEQKGLLHTE